MSGVPVNDDGGEEVQPGHSEVLALGCSITDFTLAPYAQGVFQRMMRFALIQADLGTALHGWSLGAIRQIRLSDILFAIAISAAYGAPTSKGGSR